MIEDLALWFMCNPMAGEPGLCVVNTLLIYPGILGLFSVLLVYIVGLPVLIWMQVRSALKMLRDKLRNKES